MDLESFYALRQGPATQVDGMPAHLRVQDLGILRVPSGLLEASDPFVSLGDGTVFVVEPGDYEAYVTVADISSEQDGSHEREAYLSIVMREGAVASVEAASSVRGAPEANEYWGVGVDAGTVAFCDHEAVGRCMPAEGEDTPWDETVFDHDGDDAWFNLMDSPEHLGAGIANIVMPLAESGENIVLCHSGWGDGFYPVLAAKDNEGNTLALHIDLLVVGEPEDDDEEDIPLVDGSVLKDDGSIEAPASASSPAGEPAAEREPDQTPGEQPPLPESVPAVESSDPGQIQGEDLGLSAFGFTEESAPEPEPAKKPGFFRRLLSIFKRG